MTHADFDEILDAIVDLTVEDAANDTGRRLAMIYDACLAAKAQLRPPGGADHVCRGEQQRHPGQARGVVRRRLDVERGIGGLAQSRRVAADLTDSMSAEVRSYEVAKNVLWRHDGTVHTNVRYFEGTEEQWKKFQAELAKSSDLRHRQAMRELRETNVIAKQKALI